MNEIKQPVQWWLAELDQYGNVSQLVDGSHSEESGAHRAYYILQRLGFVTEGRHLAVVKCEVFQATPNSDGVNQDALNSLNSIGLKP